MSNAYALHISPEAPAYAFLWKVIVWDWPDPMPNLGPVDKVRPT
jgi:hypothetical protein